jgi:hypothetical protein
VINLKDTSFSSFSFNSLKFEICRFFVRAVMLKSILALLVNKSSTTFSKMLEEKRRESEEKAKRK